MNIDDVSASYIGWYLDDIRSTPASRAPVPQEHARDHGRPTVGAGLTANAPAAGRRPAAHERRPWYAGGTADRRGDRHA